MHNDAKEERLPKGTKPLIISLGEAFSIVRDIYEQGGGKISYDLFSKLTGNSRSSSSFIRKLYALKSYGLVVIDTAKETLALSDTGTSIAAPQTYQAGASAQKDAFLKVEVFKRIYERHKGKLLPVDEFLRNIIEQDCRIPHDLSEQWVTAFKEAARSAGLLHDRGDGKIQIMESRVEILPKTTNTVSLEESFPVSESISTTVERPELPANEMISTSVPFSASGHCTRIEVSTGYALFTIPDRLTVRDAKKLKGALSGLSQIIDSMVDEKDSEQNGVKDG